MKGSELCNTEIAFRICTIFKAGPANKVRRLIKASFDIFGLRGSKKSRKKKSTILTQSL